MCRYRYFSYVFVSPCHGLSEVEFQSIFCVHDVSVETILILWINFMVLTYCTCAYGQAGFDVGAVDKEGYSVLHWCVTPSDDPSCLKVLHVLVLFSNSRCSSRMCSGA
jgi:hypothetical protein